MLLCLIHLTLLSQTPNLSIDAFKGNSILETSQINCIFQDKTGFLWFGTIDGLIRYDGYEFRYFNHIPDNSSGLSSSYITDIKEDKSGNLWIATQGGGLNKYNPDTQTFDSWVHNSQNKNSLPENNINSIAIDKQGYIYIGMFYKGFVRFNPVSEKFQKIRFVNKINENGVLKIQIDGKQRIWVSVINKGVYMADLKKINKNTFNIQYFTHFQHDSTNQHSICSNNVKQIFEQNGKTIWFVCKNKICKLNNSGTSFQSYTIKQINVLNSISDICLSAKNKFLLVVTTSGIFQFNENAMEHPKHSPILLPVFSAYNKRNFDIHCIFSDRSNTLWVGTNKGLYKGHHPKFYTHSVHLATLNTVNCITENSNGDLLFGLWTEGLFGSRKDKSTHYPIPINMVSKNIITLYRSLSGQIWIGTWDGLFKMEKENDNIHFTKFKLSSKNNIIRDITEDADSSLWVASWGKKDSALFRIDNKTNRVASLPTGKNGASYPAFTCVLMDNNNVLWAGTRVHGLNKIVRDKKGCYKYKTYYFNPDNKNSLCSNTINTMYIDSRKRFWIGTQNGLCLMDREKENCITFQKKDGLPENSIINIIEDKHANLWISTKFNLCKIPSDTMRFIVFSKEDGIDFEIFTPRSAFQTNDGKLFFGGEGGYLEFYPDSIEIRKFNPPVVFTDVWISHEKVIPGQPLKDGRVLIDKDISETKEIQLAYNDKVIAFQVAALDYIAPANLQYAYKLVGFDKSWNIANAYHRKISYTNLVPGNYTLKVRATNSDNVWSNNTATIHINITPPFWSRDWFIIVFSITIFLLLLKLHKIRTNYLKNQKEKIEQLVDQRTKELREANKKISSQKQAIEILAKKNHKANQMKLRFFTNISHEFRTPLTLIKAPIDKVLRKFSLTNEVKNELQLAKSNVNRLLLLIAELIDYRKIDTGKAKLNISKINGRKYLSDTLHLFGALAEKREIDLRYNLKLSEKDEIWVDKEKMDKILYNLLSNAVKFTPRQGKIVLSGSIILPDKKADILNHRIKNRIIKNNNCSHLLILVSDTGKGIKKEEIPHVFKRFYQTDDLNYSGSGIGLSLSQILVQLHYGEIVVESTYLKGTTFTFCLPADKKFYKNKDNAEFLESNSDVKTTRLETNIIKPERFKKTDREESSNKKYSVLIVEDNAEMLQYLENTFLSEYRVFTAIHGKKGLEKAINKMPDIIISDIMMPQMDGIALCQKLKTDVRTSHIPVILLTARSRIHDQLNGLQTGADDYISKPFDVDILKQKTMNLIKSRELLRDKFMKEYKIEPSKLNITPPDQKFLQKTIQIIEENMDKNKIDTSVFTQSLNLSQTSLYRKINALTGKSLHEFVLSIRIKRAAQLFRNGETSVSTVAYMVGFSAPEHFSRRFKSEFNSSPSQYIREQQTGNNNTENAGKTDDLNRKKNTIW